MPEPIKILNPSEYEYLEGPKSRTSELKFAFQVFFQFIKGFRCLHFLGPCITVFGSARFKEGHLYYEKARAVGKAIANVGFTTMTGGGPGIMEAANRGAFENGGKSVGVNIQLPHEQFANLYLHRSVTLKFFFVRKVLLLKYSYAFIVLPGGWGTMDEMFETLTLVQTGVIHNFPVVLIGKDYYQDLMNYLHFMEAQKTISTEDLKLVKLTDDIDEAMIHISKYITDNYQIKKKMRRRLWWLLESRQ